MKKLVIAINKHPRSGKSTFAKVLQLLLERKGMKVNAIHTCDEDQAPGSTLWDLEDEADTEVLAAFLDGGDTVVVDVGSEQAAVVTEFFSNEGVYEVLSEMDTELTIAIPVARGVDMTEEIVRLGECFSDNADYVIVHNEMAPEDDGHDYWTRSYGHKAMNYLGAVEISMPGFQADCLAELESSHAMGLATALYERKALPRFLRDQIHRWELTFAESLAEAENALIVSRIDHSRSVYATKIEEDDLD